MNSPPDRNRRLLAGLLLSLAGIGVCVFVFWLLGVQFSRGDAYPRYSTYRADPLGTKALYESFEALSGFEVSRNLTAPRRLKLPSPSTFFRLGISPSSLVAEEIDAEKAESDPEKAKPDPREKDGAPKDESSPLDPAQMQRLKESSFPEVARRWAEAGNRIVLALSAEHGLAGKPAVSSTRPRPRGPDDRKGQEKPEKPRRFLGLAMPDFPDLSASEGGQPEGPALDLPEWHGSCYLEPEEGSGWQPLAVFEGRTVMAEKKIGSGSIVVISDCYFATNEGLWGQPHSRFLLDLAGGNHRLFFDETHLGTEEEPGLVALMRRLHLHGLLVGAILLFGLLLWQGLVPLVPVDPGRDRGTGRGNAVLGRDSVEGLIALLRRGLPPSKVLLHCLDRWAQHPEGRSAVPAASVESAKDLAAGARAGSLAAAYIAIRNLLNPRRSPTATHHGSTRSP